MTTSYRLSLAAGVAAILGLGSACLFPGPAASGSVTYVDPAPVDATWSYYPQTDVYYSSNRSAYYHHDTSRGWIYSDHAPSHHTSPGSSISIEYVGARPYDHNTDHRRSHHR